MLKAQVKDKVETRSLIREFLVLHEKDPNQMSKEEAQRYLELHLALGIDVIVPPRKQLPPRIDTHLKKLWRTKG